MGLVESNMIVFVFFVLVLASEREKGACRHTRACPVKQESARAHRQRQKPKDGGGTKQGNQERGREKGEG